MILKNLFDYIFTGDISPLIDDVLEIIDDHLPFTCDFSGTTFNHTIERSFPDDESGMELEYEIRDSEENGGTCFILFDGMGVKKVSLYFFYEDGNQYDETIYDRE